MRNRLIRSAIFLTAMLALSWPSFAQIYFPAAAGGRTKEAKAAAAAAPKPVYDAHDISGIWVGGGNPARGPVETSMGGAPAPPMTPAGLKLFNANKPSQHQAEESRKVPPALGNDPLGKCDPLGYPRNLGNGPVELAMVPGKIFQIFEDGRRVREIWTDGRKLPEDLDPRWYGWALGHWEGNTLVVDSSDYDDRSWLDGDGHPHSDDMRLQERWAHPDAMTLEVTMTLTDPMIYTKPWVGTKQTFHMLLPKGATVMYEWYCVPSEEESFNSGVRNPAGGIASK